MSEKIGIPGTSGAIEKNIQEAKKTQPEKFVIWNFANNFKNTLGIEKYELRDDPEHFRVVLRGTNDIVASIKSEVNKDKEVLCFIHDVADVQFEDHLKNAKIKYEKSNWMGKTFLYKLDTVPLEDLETPQNKNLETKEEHIYNSNGVRVERGTITEKSKNILYFYFQREQVARIKVDENNKAVKMFAGIGNADKEVVTLVVTLCPDLPYREHLMRFFEVEANENLAKELKENFEKEKERVENVLLEYSKVEKLPGWETTDPKEHDPSNFRYIVHAIVPNSASMQILKGVISKTEYEENDSNANVDALLEPEKFLKRKYISTSVIDQAHYTLYGNHGFILKVPESKVVKADSETMVTVHSDNSEIKKEKSISAQKIIENTLFYNEVVITGEEKEKEENLEIQGGIIVVDPITKKPLDVDGSDKIERFCRQHNLPVVFLNKPLN